MVKSETKVEEKSVLESIYTLCEILRDSKLEIPEENKEFFEDTKKMNTYFSTTDIQTWILCAFISEYFENGDSSSFDRIAGFFSCSVMKFMLYKADFDILLERGLLEEESSDSMPFRRRRRFSSSSSKNFSVSSCVVDCILNNQPLLVDNDNGNDSEDDEIDVIGFLNRLSEMVEDRSDSDQPVYDLLRKLRKFENENANLDFIKKSNEIIKDDVHRLFFYDVCGDFLVSDRGSSLNATLADFYSSAKRFKAAREFMDEKNVLFREGLIEYMQKGNMMDSRITPTDKAKSMFLGENVDLFEKKISGTDLIIPDKIKEKKLFYSDENEKEIERLSEALMDNNLKGIQSRLEESNLPIGVAVLLYGAAGTGKTESVYQIAKITGRKIFHVDISSTKSCWFGESEKIIKKVFVNYHSMCKAAEGKGEPLPILFFNEADAIFSKRTDSTRSNTAQTENAIQNIILEELENLKGVLIATTNLASNFDSAFERRFLFKIKFERPSIEAKKLIWKNKLVWLSDEACNRFATSYDLSGGEIDNICRKITMDEVITGKKPSFEQIEEFCKREKLNSDIHSVGFSFE